LSVLTKIFVVLLVVLSLILSAGLIVFVNRQEDFKASAASLQKQLAVERQQTSLVTEQVASEKSHSQAIATELTNQINALQTEVSNKDADLAKRDVQINELNGNLSQANASNKSTAEALKVAQDTIKTQDDNAAQVRTNDDKLQKEIVEDSNRITDLTNSLEVTTRHDRLMAEQNAQISQQLAVANEALRKYNISPTGTVNPAGGAINVTPSVNINGVVRDFRKINGVPYATISVGSADAVTRNMQFKVIDPLHGAFLGYLTVDNVQDHEATGHLSGPGVEKIQSNISEVRTQL